MGDFPWMTDQGTFIINGAERVVVSASSCARPASTTPRPRTRHRPPLYSRQGDPQPRRLARVRDVQQGPALRQGRPQAQDRGDHAAARRRLRAERRDRALFGESTPTRSTRTSQTLDKDPAQTQDEALIEVYKKLRPGDPPTGDNARQLVESLFFNFRRYDLGRVGRYKLNKKLGPSPRMGIAAENPRRAHDHQARTSRDRRPPDRAQQRPTGHTRTTSTTSATAASAPTAS
jgi:DNA-directed RNA polymerase subunit beta